MKRRLLNLLTALSLLLCVALCVLWVRSYRGGRDYIKIGWGRRDFHILHSHGGKIALRQIAEVDERTGQLTVGAAFPSLVVPDSLLVVVTATIPVAILVYQHVQQRRRRKLSLCAACGYDMRATPGRCPECGSPASVSTLG